MNKTTLLAAIGLCASPTWACESDLAPISKLPGETEAAAMARNERIEIDLQLVGRVQAERRYVEHAPKIYVGEVESRLAGERGAVVMPLKAYRGTLPHSSQNLLFTPASLCTGDEISDGEGWRGKPGDLVVIFEGLKPTMWRPNGVDSILATSIRSPELLRWIRQFGTIVKGGDADRE
jgi:hypothetical protein